MKLRYKPPTGEVSKLLEISRGENPDGDRHEFLQLVELATSLKTLGSSTD